MKLPRATDARLRISWVIACITLAGNEEITMDASEFFKGVVKRNYEDFEKKPDDLRFQSELREGNDHAQQSRPLAVPLCKATFAACADASPTN
jgi:hypothetical protein